MLDVNDLWGCHLGDGRWGPCYRRGALGSVEMPSPGSIAILSRTHYEWGWLGRAVLVATQCDL